VKEEKRGGRIKKEMQAQQGARRGGDHAIDPFETSV
jgi:hypothetical protein